MKEKGRNRNLSFECIETKVVIDSQMRNIFKQHIKFKKKQIIILNYGVQGMHAQNKNITLCSRCTMMSGHHRSKVQVKV